MKETKIYIEDKNYPLELKKIKNPPKHIYVIGNINLLQKQKISVIGSRNNTDYGKRIALNFAKKLSDKGYTIVSGLANGIDSYAHIGAMVGKGKTIAILPCGFEHIFPESNKKLYQQIIQNGGLAISEYSIKEKAIKENFIKRNRIVAGISKAVLVVEGSYRSGTTITVNYAKENGIPVFCIPGNIDNDKSYTPNILLKQGGILVTNEIDIINKIQNKTTIIRKREKKIELENDIIKKYNDMYTYLNKSGKCSNIEAKANNIYSVITEEPIYIDDIVYKTQKSVSQVNYEITMLMIDGYIQELPGKKYIRTDKLYK